MTNRDFNQHRAYGFPFFELLEKRELMSVSPMNEHLGLLAETAATHITAKAALAATKAAVIRPVASVGGAGLTGEYFKDAAMQTPYLLRTDGTINLSADSSVKPANSVQWTGQISPSYTEAYTFSTVTNGGVQLWVNGQLLINEPTLISGMARAPMKIDLVAGQKYSVVLDYTRTSTRNISAKLLWASVHQKQGVIPKNALFPNTSATLPQTHSGLIGEYFIGKNFNTPVMYRVDPGINLNFGTSSPTSLIPSHSSYSIRWTGQVQPSYTETYTFKTISDDGVRLYVNDELLIDDWTDHLAKTDTASISLAAGVKYDIKLEYYQDKGVASIQLAWSSPSQPSQGVPASALSSTPAASAGVLTAISSSDGSINLSWTGSSDAVGYSVEQTTDGGTTYTPIATTAANVTTYEVTGLSPNSTYAFQIVPLGSADTSTPSNMQQTATLTESPASLTARPNSDGSTTLNWSDVTGENGFVVLEQMSTPTARPAAVISGESYLPQDTTSTAFTPVATVPAGTLSYLLTGLTPGTGYQFEVEALNADGVASQPSNTAAATTVAAVVSNITATVTSTTSMTLNWIDVPGETGFAIDRATSIAGVYTQIASVAARVTTYTDSGLTAGNSYYYQIRTLNGGGSSLPTTPTQVVALLSAPTGVTTTVSSASNLVLNWADVANENGYEILEFVNGSSTFNSIGTVPTGVTTFNVTGLTGGTGYEFAVVALNALGDPSPASDPTIVTTPPIAPATVLATAFSATQENLTWNDVQGETGFVVQRSSDGIDNWSTIATLSSGTTSYPDTTLTPGTAYFYRVLGLDGGGTSDPSTVFSAVTLTNTPASFASAATTINGTVLHWADVANEQGFAILQSTDGGATFSRIGIAPASVTSFTVSGLTAGTGYQYEVEAINSAGAASIPSQLLSVTTLTLPPLGVVATPVSTTQATVVWSDVVGETGFVVSRSLDGVSGWTTVGTLPTGTLSFSDAGLSPGTIYYYRVQALNVGGASAPSLTATTLTLPASPVAALTGLSVSQSQVSWPAVSGATQYLIERSINGTSGWTTAATAVGSATSAVVANLTPSTVYYYRVSATNASGTSTPSTVVGQMTAPLATYAARTQIYGATVGGVIYSLDMSGGTSTPIGQLVSGAAAADRDPITGLIYYYKTTTSPQQVWSWDPTTGNNEMVATDFLGTNSAAGTFRADGTAFVIGANGNLISVATGSQTAHVIGQLTLAGQAFATSQIGNMCFAPNGSLYMTSGGEIYTVNTTTAAMTPLIPLGLGNLSIVFGQNGLMYFTTTNGQQYTLNLSSLVASLLGNTTVPTFTSLTADPIFTSLTMTATASPATFAPGSPGSYALQVLNTSGDATANPVTITTTLPTGLTYTSISGTGWTASVAGQVVTLTYSAGIAANASLPPITLNVAVGSAAFPLVTTTFTVNSLDFDKSTTTETTAAVTVVT